MAGLDGENNGWPTNTRGRSSTFTDALACIKVHFSIILFKHRVYHGQSFGLLWQVLSSYHRYGMQLLNRMTDQPYQASLSLWQTRAHLHKTHHCGHNHCSHVTQNPLFILNDRINMSTILEWKQGRRCAIWFYVSWLSWFQGKLLTDLRQFTTLFSTLNPPNVQVSDFIVAPWKVNGDWQNNNFHVSVSGLNVTILIAILYMLWQIKGFLFRIVFEVNLKSWCHKIIFIFTAIKCYFRQ